MSRRFRYPLLLVAAALALGTAGSAQPATKKLVATVGPGFNINLTMGGKKVKSLRAGSYRISVQDKSDIHNFHLKGKGVNKDSGVDAVGTKTWTVKLVKGSYTYVCDPHKQAMRGAFTVT